MFNRFYIALIFVLMAACSNSYSANDIKATEQKITNGLTAKGYFVTGVYMHKTSAVSLDGYATVDVNHNRVPGFPDLRLYCKAEIDDSGIEHFGCGTKQSFSLDH